MESVSHNRFSRPKKAHIPPPPEGSYEARQLRECTFSPKVNGSKSHHNMSATRNRTLEEFLKSQQDHLDRAKNKIEVMRSQKLQEELAEMRASSMKSVSPRALEKLY